MFKYVLLLPMALFLLPIPADAKSFTAANGVVLPAPKLNTLTCEQLGDLMDAYMTSHYRNLEVVPRNHPDRPIFDYENALATLHYEDCQVGMNHFENSAPAFSKGFN